MFNVHLERVRRPKDDSYIQAVMRDYTTPVDCRVFKGESPLGETLLAFVGKDGSAFFCTDQDPDGYLDYSDTLADLVKEYGSYDNCPIGKINAVPHHGGVDEWEMESGTFDYNATELDIPAEMSLV